MSVRLVATSLVVGVLVLMTVWVTDLSFARVALLAPVLVVGVAALAGLFVLWGRVGYEHFRESPHQRTIVLLAVLFAGAVVLLTLLGVKLPQE